jgi:plasmid stabilization system protein ParE
MSSNRPPVRISFKYNKDTGEIVEFIVDDNSPTASEEFHDRVAEAVATSLSRRAEIYDAGREPVADPLVIGPTPEPETDKQLESESE